MCGIAGAAGGDAEAVARMTRSLAHRGPDAEGLWSDPERALHLGHRRLAVVDLAGGEQPMWTAERELGVVFNGEIYEHGALRKELEARGHVFASDHSDTEVLLHGWREWGEGLLERLNGMFAFAILDRRDGSFFLARDRFGQKPLYWAHCDGVFAFASEAEALLRHPAVGREPSALGLHKYYAHGYLPAPHTLWRDVHKLPAGHCLRFAPGSAPSLRRWWEFVLEPEEPAGGDAEAAYAAPLRDAIERAVARRLVADVPVGVFLSGGLDSSAVASAAARHHKPGELLTFSIGFDEASFDETPAARRAAAWVGSAHRATHFSARRAAEVWPEVIGHLDEPLADPSLLPTSVLCAAARREVTVALGGDGADELFAGYDPFRALSLAGLYTRVVPRPLHRAIKLLASRLPVSHRYLSADFALKRALGGLSHRPALWNPLWMAPLGPRELAEVLGEPSDPEEIYAEAIAAWESADGLGPVDRTLQFFTRLYLQDDILPKLDRASMQHGLELRSPFLDIELVDLVRRIPARFKFRRGQGKWILRRALAEWLPRDLTRRKKQGFGVPVGRWLAEGRAPFDTPPADARLREHWQAHRAGRRDERLALYAARVLEGQGVAWRS